MASLGSFIIFEMRLCHTFNVHHSTYTGTFGLYKAGFISESLHLYRTWSALLVISEQRRLKDVFTASLIKVPPVLVHFQTKINKNQTTPVFSNYLI